MSIQNDNQNTNQNHNQNHNHINNHNDNHNHNHNHNQVSSITNRNTNRSTEETDDELKSYISYLEGKNPMLKGKIDLDNILFYFYREMIGEPTLQVEEDLDKWSKEFSKSIIIEALSRSREAYKPMSYAVKILTNWKQANIKNFQDIMNLDKGYQ